MIESVQLTKLAKLIKEKEIVETKSPLRVGVDLGTANIVMVVVDEDGEPIAGRTHESKVVKDGIVVDYIGAIQRVREMKAELEEALGKELTKAACAIPPGILKSTSKAIANVVESAGFEVTNVVDEPTAAALALNIRDGGVVDIGGGTTGISIFEDSEVVYTADEPTGGWHMTLTLAGYYGISIEEAELIKRDPSKDKDIFPMVSPVVDKMAYLVQGFVRDYDVENLYLVGGATSFTDFEKRFESIVRIPTFKAEEALLVTPYGIALSCK